MVPTILLLLLILIPIVASDGQTAEAETLLRFKSSLKNSTRLKSWNGTSPAPCSADADRSSWAGVLCNKGKVWGLKLEDMGLAGSIDVAALSKLQGLRSVSLMGNAFKGHVPNFFKLAALKNVYLSRNEFSGKVQARAFAGMTWLKKLHLAKNSFSGRIPAELAALPRLIVLRLEGNEFEGPIPDFPHDRLKVFNVSNNKLSGEIPHGLRHFSNSSFSGNKDLCGEPLIPCPNHGELYKYRMIMVFVLVTSAVAALLALVIVILRRKRTSPQPNLTVVEGGAAQAKPAGDVERGASPASSMGSSKRNVKLTFLRDDVRAQFDMADLLKASAEVLGSGVFGSTYRATVNRDRAVVVKRFKHMNNVGRQEFEDHFRQLGRLSHENVLPMVAYCYRREEKLLVTNYVQNFSLAVQLHGGRRAPDWPARLGILKGVARGLHYLYTALPNLTAPHGHLKSSNVLLDSELRALLTDYGLVPMVNQEDATEHMVLYKSPEYKASKRINKKTDVWSFGVLVLETLTGRFPSNLIGGDAGDLAMWVESTLRGGGEGVFDKEMGEQCRGEMMKLLELGLECCRQDPGRRPEIAAVVERIEAIKEKDNVGEEYQEYYSTYASEADARSVSDDA